MFTGIIEELGSVESIQKSTQSQAAGARLKIHCQRVLADISEGASIAVNGVCLTAVEVRADSFSADLAPETLLRSNLGSLGLGNTQVTDAGLAHFKDCKILHELTAQNTQVTDAGLAHFKGKLLRNLHIDNTAITDLAPLQGMPLEEVRLTPKNITRGLDILRDMKSLKTIGIAGQQPWPPAEFWERYDKGEFK